jgi:hypothetical protein
MSFSAKEAAENLMKIADALEKEAHDNTFFVCNQCNHTANLTTINARRSKAASENNVKNVNAVTINDRVACPACEGTMSYSATEESSKYWVDSAEDALPEIAPKEDDENKEEGAPDTQPIDEEKSVFKPVDDQAEEGEIDLSFKGDEDAPEAEKPEEETPIKEPADEAEDTSAVVEEEVSEEPKKKPKKKKDDIDFPKEDVPKFEKMPKDASDEAYEAALRKYSF